MRYDNNLGKKNIPPLNKLSRDLLTNLCETDESNRFMNDLLTITKKGKKRSRMQNDQVTSHYYWKVSGKKDQIQLVIFEHK